MPIVLSGDVEIHHETYGSGPPVLLIAGTGYPGATWSQATIAPLADLFRVTIFDHRGTGKSGGSGGDYSTKLFAGDAAAVLESVASRPAHIIGHSMGGRVAQWLAVEWSGLVGSLILVGSGSGAGGEVSHRATGIPVPTVLRLMDLGYEGFIRDLQRRTFFTDAFVTEHSVEVDWLAAAFWENRPAIENYLKHVVARQAHDTTAVLADIQCPALVVVGDLDTHAGDTGSHVEQSRYLADHLPNAELMMIPGVTHGVFWERPEATMRPLIEWLSSTEASAGDPHDDGLQVISDPPGCE